MFVTSCNKSNMANWPIFYHACFNAHAQLKSWHWKVVIAILLGTIISKVNSIILLLIIFITNIMINLDNCQICINKLQQNDNVQVTGKKTPIVGLCFWEGLRHSEEPTVIVTNFHDWPLVLWTLHLYSVIGKKWQLCWSMYTVTFSIVVEPLSTISISFKRLSSVVI